MSRDAKLYRVGFHTCYPQNLSGAVHYHRCGMVVGNWEQIIAALERHRHNFWTEVFSQESGRRIAGPFAPAALNEKPPSVVRTPGRGKPNATRTPD